MLKMRANCQIESNPKGSRFRDALGGAPMVVFTPVVEFVDTVELDVEEPRLNDDVVSVT